MDSYRILFFISALRCGGAENHLLNLCRYLASRGHAPAVCTLSAREDGLESEFLMDGVSLYRLPLASLRQLSVPRKFHTLSRIVRGVGPDLIHAHLYHAEMVAAASALVHRVPLVATRHSAGLEFNGWRRYAITAIHGRFSRIIAVSGDAASEALTQGYSSDRVETIPNGVDTRRFRPLEGRKRDEKRKELFRNLFPGSDPASALLVGSIGGLKPVKNYSLLIRAAARLAGGHSGRGRELKTVIIGEGPERGSLVELAGELGLDRSIALPGYSDRTEELFPLFDIFVLPSRTEGVPMVILEAMASGLPCVASDVGGIGVVLGKTGRLVKEGDEEAMCRAIGELAEDEAARTGLGREARVRVMERFDIDIWGDRTVQVYRSIIRRTRDG